jgi:hypothetical protein
MSRQTPRNNAQPAALSGEPDLSRCRAKLAGFGDYVDCLVARPEYCRYALQFGDSHLCQHAERHNIAARPQPDHFQISSD